jgi:uncharacterized protein
MFAETLPPGSHRPRFALGGNPRYSFPSSPVTLDATRMARLTVRVIPRSARTAVERSERGVVIRVRAAPEGGRATEEARRALAGALGVAPSDVGLVRGATSRTKVFEVDGLDEEGLVTWLGGT